MKEPHDRPDAHDGRPPRRDDGTASRVGYVSGDGRHGTRGPERRHLVERDAPTSDGRGLFRVDDRGVGEVLGYALIFAIILGSSALVFTVGFGVLEDMQADQQEVNAEEAFIRVAGKFDQMETRAVPRRAGELSVSPGRLGIEDGVTVNVSVETPSGTYSREFDANALAYEVDETRLSIEGTGVFRSDGGSVISVDPPTARCSNRTAMITVATLNHTRGPSSVSSDLVTIVGTRQNASLWYPLASTGQGTAASATAVTVNVTSENEQGWRRYFESADGWTDPDADGDYTCTTDRVVVRHVRLGVRFV